MVSAGKSLKPAIDFDDAAILVDANTGLILSANRRLENLLGYAPGELTGLPHRTLSPAATARSARKLFPKAGSGLRGSHQEVSLLHRDGRTLRMDVITSTLDLDGRALLVALFRDGHDRLKREKELVRASRMDSFRTLASNIAHDFNNLLTAILGNITMATMHQNSHSFVQERLLKAEKACLRAHELAHQLLTFADDGSKSFKPCSINELLRDSTLFHAKNNNIRFHMQLPADLWKVEGNKSQLVKVIDNLLLNAQQAMPQGGTIDMAAENLTVGYSSALPLKKGGYVKLAIQDHGVGIPPEHLDQIFEPFFRGSARKKSQGLGLTAAYTIMKQHGGHIAVESQYGAGATFYLFIPAFSPLPQTDEDEKVTLYFGQGKILLMDDEAMILEVTGEMLEKLGYQVHFAREGAEALNLYRQAQNNGQPFDAVILDLTVPGGLGAKEIVAQLLTLNPNVKTLVSTGYSDDLILANFHTLGFTGVIPKPYRLKELSEAVYMAIYSTPS